MTYKPKYRYSGICLCGHSWDDHHLGMVCDPKYVAETGESYIPQECEYYGCNEGGGFDDEGNPHCGGFVDRQDPNEERRKQWDPRP